MLLVEVLQLGAVLVSLFRESRLVGAGLLLQAPLENRHFLLALRAELLLGCKSNIMAEIKLPKHVNLIGAIVVSKNIPAVVSRESSNSLFSASNSSFKSLLSFSALVLAARSASRSSCASASADSASRAAFCAAARRAPSSSARDMATASSSSRFTVENLSKKQH